MKMYYVYLNEYSHGELYVGQHCSHTGTQDLYQGSSKLAKVLKLKLVKQTILEACKDAVELSTREDYWIDYYCRRYGLHDSVMFNSNSKGIWSAKYPKHGRMLNCHNSGAQNLRNPGVHEKSVDSRKRLGSYKYSPQLHTPEAVAKAVTTRKANGVYAKIDTSLLHTPEAVAKAVTTRKANGVYDKQAKRISIKNKSPEMIALQQSGRRQKATKYRLTGDYDFVGTITDCAKVLHCNTPVLKQFICSNKLFKGCKIERL